MMHLPGNRLGRLLLGLGYAIDGVRLAACVAVLLAVVVLVALGCSHFVEVLSQWRRMPSW